ncbi:hypothetical protein B7494_g1990 [Chlorociboria aeruginascens]|nr:hypothetical protein B7494_g1990 [Chlorociboria aeruginascens]
MAVPPHIEPAKSITAFKYEPLDHSALRPSIRLVILEPGIRESSIRIGLVHKSFGDRPIYEALSYTWGSPDVLKIIQLNGINVNVRENLWSALVHLRDPVVQRVLWIDAISINQDDNEERNNQVRLMAYIYSRAETVLVWLGLPPLHLDISPNGDFENPSLRGNELSFVSSCAYWKRLWIVQEIGAATKLMVYCGQNYWGWDSFFEQIKNGSADHTTGPALKLAKQREGRHGDSFLLANLLEVCQDSLCDEPRDHVYGFVGIAHDCQDDSFPIDYSKSLFELYQDVMIFRHRSLVENEGSLKKPKKKRGPRPVHGIETVHFSQLLQRLLGVSDIQKDISRIGGRPTLDKDSMFEKSDIPTSFFEAIGALRGSISILGPSYGDILAIPRATKEWALKLRGRSTDVAILREQNEGFMRVILKLEQPNIAKIFSYNSQFMWKASSPSSSFGSSGGFGMVTEPQEVGPFSSFGSNANFGKITDDFPSQEIIKLSANTEDQSVQPVSTDPLLFLTDTDAIGLAPHDAKMGDLVYQFCDSDVVAIVRKYENSYVKIVGSARMARKQYKEGAKFDVPLKKVYDGGTETADTYLDFDRGTSIYMDIYTLQALTQ